MNPNLWSLFQDAILAMQARFKPAHEYWYGLPVFVFVMVALGAINLVSLVPVFGKGINTLLLSILICVTRWLVLTRAAAEILRPNRQSPRIPFLGYTLMTESLIIPTVLMMYIPELATFFLLWAMWAFWVQALGFYRISQEKWQKIAVVYVIAWAVSVVLIVLFMTGLISAGYFDANEIRENIEKIMLMWETQPK